MHAGVVTLRMRRVLCVVEAVDGARLRRVGTGGEGEIRVAAEFAQEGKLVVHAALRAVGMRVVQCPVAMHEAPAGATRRITREEAVAGEVGDALLDLRAERGLGVAVVVEVDFHFRAGRAAQLGEVVEQRSGSYCSMG